MSTILEALQKARRDNPIDHVPSLLDSPAVRVRRRRRWLRRVVWAVLTMVLIAAVGSGAVFLARHYGLLQRSTIYVVASPPPVIPAAAPAQSIPALADPISVITLSQPTPVATTMITISDPAPRPAVPQVAAAQSTPLSDAVEAAMRSSVDLPTPVPISQLDPHVEGSLVSRDGKVKVPVSKNGFVLGTIICEGDKCIALVNGTAVRAGRTYGDFKVLEITPTEVVVQRQGENPITLTPTL
jgi:hypothetical protein